jgi:transcriptional regulator MraZ
MDRFATSTINKVDKKGRVSIPASFRSVLKGQNTLHCLLSVDHPVVEAGGPTMMQWYERRLEQMDPLSEEYEIWSFHILGDALEMKLDGEGRIQLNDRMREQTGIDNQVLFEGRGLSFWLWEPGRYEAYRTEARAKVRQMRRNLGSSSGAPAVAGSRAGT